MKDLFSSVFDSPKQRDYLSNRVQRFMKTEANINCACTMQRVKAVGGDMIWNLYVLPRHENKDLPSFVISLGETDYSADTWFTILEVELKKTQSCWFV